MAISTAIISISWLGISRSLAIVSMVSIAISMVSISISMTIVSISWLSLSRTLAIVNMMSISTIANMMPITISMAISISGLSSSSRFSRPLAIISMVAISTITISMAISMAIIAISRLGHSHTQKGKRNGKQEFHVVSC